MRPSCLSVTAHAKQQQTLPHTQHQSSKDRTQHSPQQKEACVWWSRQAECWKAQRCSSQHCCLLSQDSSVGQAEARGQWTPWCQVVWERDRPPTLQLGEISMGERAGAPAVPTPLFGKGCKFHWMRKDRRYWFRLTYWQLCVPRWQLYPFDSWRIFRLERRWGSHNWGGNVRQTGGETEQALQWLASIHIWATVKNKEVAFIGRGQKGDQRRDAQS